MRPYYEHAGITIYHGADRVEYWYEARTKERLQAISRAYRQTDEVGRRASRMEGR